MSCPWAKIDTPEPVNFVDIVFEERDLQTKERKDDVIKDYNQAAAEDVVEDTPVEPFKNISSNANFENDAIIAQMLQIQFDNEYDQDLKCRKKRFNATWNYRRALNNDFDSESEEEALMEDREYCNRFDPLGIELAFIPTRSYKVKNDGKMLPKHDVIVNGTRNTCKMLYPPDFLTGDGELFDSKLSEVRNSLKCSLCKPTNCRYAQERLHKSHVKKEAATNLFKIDEQNTRMILYKMIANQLLKSINGVVSVGEEAVILHGVLNPCYPNATGDWPMVCAIKVFRTTPSKFKGRDKYVKEDHRFKDIPKHQTIRRTIQLCAEKEMVSLIRLKNAGIRCPQVIALKHHILVMSFIGQNSKPAPKLRNIALDDASWFIAYEEVKDAMKKLYDKANLIHTDFSGDNILWCNHQCYFIDLSQSVERTHKFVNEYLYKDCDNVIKFFTKRIHGKFTETPDELFVFITGYDFKDRTDTNALQSVKDSNKMKAHLVN